MNAPRKNDAARALTILVILMLSTAHLSAASTSDVPRLAVMDLGAGEGISVAQARTLTGMLRTAMHETESFTLINREDIEDVAENHRIELVLCDDDACLLRIGSLLGAEKIVAGEIGLIVDEFVINARLVDIGGEALINEQVATRRSSQSALALERAMVELAAELAGKTPPPDSPMVGRGERHGYDARVNAIDEERIYLDVGRWDGMRKGTVLEAMNPLLNGHIGESEKEPAEGKLEVVEVFGSYSRAQCVPPLSPKELQPGTPLRTYTFPRWFTLESILSYYVPLTSGSFDIAREELGSWGSVTYLRSRATLEAESKIEGDALGASLGFRVHRMFQVHLRGGLAHVSLRKGILYSERFDAQGNLLSSHWDRIKTNSYSPFFGGAVRLGIHHDRHIQIFTEYEILYFDGWRTSEGFDHYDPESFAGSVRPWGIASIRIPMRIRSNDWFGVTISPGVGTTVGGNWRVSQFVVHVGPSFSI